MHFPSPVAFWVGPWPVHWYGLSYGCGMLMAWGYIRFWSSWWMPSQIPLKLIDGFINWAMLGIVVGGRLGHIFLYAPHHFLEHPLEILKVWKGGMAFHGGAFGLMMAAVLYSRWFRLYPWHMLDGIACAAPIGLFFGRIANFINQEVYGRPTESAFGIVFPEVDFLPRHPSQLYEAFTEGLVLFILLFFLSWKKKWHHIPGRLSGSFLIGYSLARCFCEIFRSPDGMVGIFTLGQLYTLPFMGIGLFLLRKNRSPFLR